MKKIIFIGFCFLLSTTVVFGQKLMKISEYDLGTAVPREAGDNETVVVVRSTLPLEFESTMDKAVEIYDQKEESGFTHYYIKFSTLPKYKGRKLKIKSYGFETHTEPMNLVAKVPLGILVVDPDGSVGVGCYFQHLNEGNKLFNGTFYEDAKTEYYKALDCSDIPEDNDLSKKIEDAGNCADYKRTADILYSEEKWEDALREYEKVVSLNLVDNYSKERAESCKEIIANLPRIITGTVVDASTGNPLEGVTIKAEYEQVDKKGRVQYDKKGAVKTTFKTVGTTGKDGTYSITVLNKSKNLEYDKGSAIHDVAYAKKSIIITGDKMDIALDRSMTIGEGVETLDTILNLFK